MSRSRITVNSVVTLISGPVLFPTLTRVGPIPKDSPRRNCVSFGFSIRPMGFVFCVVLKVSDPHLIGGYLYGRRDCGVVGTTTHPDVFLFILFLIFKKNKTKNSTALFKP